MKIASSDLVLRSDHAAATRREQSESLRRWIGPTRPDFEGSSSANRRPLFTPAAVTRLSDAARALANPPPPPVSNQDLASKQAQAIDASAEAVNSDPFLQLVKSMVEMLTGQPIRVFSASELTQQSRHIEVSSSEVAQAHSSSSQARPAGYGVEYDFHSVYEEAEVTQLSASGVIRTTDGAEISFQLDVTMERYFREETNISIRAGDAVRKDPLVLNFGGTAAQLSSQRFQFDLDRDGRDEALPLFASGSGYLALDLNHNGRIDSGAELFGPASNSGFRELDSHDQDGNGWIDENDSIFNELQVWMPAAEGPGTLTGLKALNVGALSLAHVATPFELRGNGNADLGGVRASSVWLDESGRPGTLQEIDLSA